MKEHRESKKLLDLFVKRIEKKELPEPDTNAYLERVKTLAELESRIDKHQHTIEELEAPIYAAKLQALGLSPEEFMKLLKEEGEANKQFREKFGREYMEHYWQEAAGPADNIDYIDPFCRTISVRVCQERVCIDQPVPMQIDDIWLTNGAGGSFARVGNFGFTFDDSVAGSSSWNWTYHRQSQTSEDQINIWSGIELVEPATVHAVGIIFERSPNRFNNGACAHGKDPLALPPSWGRAKMYYEINLKYKEPGSTWNNWFDGARIIYEDLGPVESNISCWSNNVLGHSGRRDVSVVRNKTFRAGTQILLEAYLSYWIKGLGEEGRASVSYDLNAMPYVNIEACSYEYPETMCIHVPDYLP